MAATLPQPAQVSPVDAAREAIAHTKRHLFPFDFSRWVTLGFVAFLDQCGRGGGGSFNFPGPGGGGGGEDFSTAAEWFSAHVPLVVAIAGVVLALIVALAAAILWLNSRGVFMYLDNVVTGRAEVGRPWREHAEAARSYFAWSFGLSLVSLVGVLLILFAGVMVLAGPLRGGPFGVGAIAALVVLGVVFVLFIVVVTVLSLALRDFAAPIQYRLGVSCGTAMGIVVTEVKAYPLAFFIYVLLKIVFSIALGLALVLAACVTCCCALLPVITQTIFQPALYFERAWSVCFLRPMGYDLLVPASKGEVLDAPGMAP